MNKLGKVAVWAVSMFALPIVFIIYLIHRTLDLIFGSMNIMADGFDRAADMVDRLPGGLS